MIDPAPDSGAERTAMSTLMQIRAHLTGVRTQGARLDVPWMSAVIDKCIDRAAVFEADAARQDNPQPEPKP